MKGVFKMEENKNQMVVAGSNRELSMDMEAS